MLRAVRDRALAERERRRRSLTRRFEKFQTDPVGFVEEGLLGFLWSKQKQIMESVRDHRFTAVQSCHDIGKTRVAAAIVSWWLSVWDPGEAFAVTTAPTFQQVRALLWREIGRVHREGNLPGRTNQTEWLYGDELVGFGLKPDDAQPTAFQGIHARRVLVAVDEACGVAGPIFDAAETLVANDDSRFLAIGNPDDPATRFGAICRPGSGWNVIKVSAFDSPNFTDEPVPDWLRPLLVGRTWVGERQRKWGETSPLYQAKVLGIFPEQSSDGLIPLAALAAAVARELEPAPEDPNELGVDVARFGDDSTVMYHRRGPRARRVEKYAGKDTMKTVGRIVALRRELGFTRVKIDDIGVGGGVSDRLNELAADPDSDFKGCEVVRINVGESPARETETERFFNLKAELSWNMRERFQEGLIDIATDEDLEAEAAAIKYEYRSNGKIIIEPKAETKKRLNGHSPDDWDALVLCFAAPQYPGSGIWEFTRQAALAVRERQAAGAVPVEQRATVWMLAPAGISTVYGMTGARYLVGPDRRVAVAPEDQDGLRSAGFLAAEPVS